MGWDGVVVVCACTKPKQTLAGLTAGGPQDWAWEWAPRLRSGLLGRGSAQRPGEAPPRYGPESEGPWPPTPPPGAQGWPKGPGGPAGAPGEARGPPRAQKSKKTTKLLNSHKNKEIRPTEKIPSARAHQKMAGTSGD